MVLPYGNPDAVAMNRADLQVPLRTSVRRGDEVAEQVLGPDLVTTVAVPPGGAVDGTTAAVLAEAGYRSMVLAGSSVSSSGPIGTAVVALPDDAGGGSLPVLVGDSPVLASMRRVLERERGDSTALALNVVAAEIVQQGFDGTGVPISYLPTGDAASFTDDDPQAARRLNELLGQLADAGAVLAGDPAALAAAATAPAELAYGAARGDELPQSYLSHWNDSAAEVSGVSASLRTSAGPDAVDPAGLIGELRNAMRPLGSAAPAPRSAARQPDPGHRRQHPRRNQGRSGDPLHRRLLHAGQWIGPAGPDHPQRSAVRRDGPGASSRGPRAPV